MRVDDVFDSFKDFPFPPRLARRLKIGQSFHCPDCGHGFPVQDPTAAKVMETLWKDNEQMRQALIAIYERCVETDYPAANMASKAFEAIGRSVFDHLVDDDQASTAQPDQERE